MIKSSCHTSFGSIRKNLLAPDTTIGFLDEAKVSEHYNDVDKFKKNMKT
jgi:hypothetical protein